MVEEDLRALELANDDAFDCKKYRSLMRCAGTARGDVGIQTANLGYKLSFVCLFVCRSCKLCLDDFVQINRLAD